MSWSNEWSHDSFKIEIIERLHFIIEKQAKEPLLAKVRSMFLERYLLEIVLSVLCWTITALSAVNNFNQQGWGITSWQAFAGMNIPSFLH